MAIRTCAHAGTIVDATRRVHRFKHCTERLLKMALEQFNSRPADRTMDRKMAVSAPPAPGTEQRLERCPSGWDSAQQIIAEVGPTAATFLREMFSSWVGCCPATGSRA